MSININSSNHIAGNTDTAHGIKTAKLVKNQQELEGQMALELIQSADISAQLPSPVGNKGHIVNIKA